MSPTEIPKVIVDSRVKRALAKPEHHLVAGVWMMNPVSFTDCGAVEYRTYFVPNEKANKRLPDAVATGFLADNQNPHGPRS